MSLSALLMLRTRLASDSDLIAFFQTHYGRAAKHLIGYKRTPNANDYPSICYVPINSTHKHNRDDDVDVSLVIGVHEPGITDDVFDGVTRLDDEITHIIAALLPLKLGKGVSVSSKSIRIIHDLGMRHPFHEAEIQLSLTVN